MTQKPECGTLKKSRSPHLYRRYFSLLAVLVLVLAFTACPNGGDDDRINDVYSAKIMDGTSGHTSTMHSHILPAHCEAVTVYKEIGVTQTTFNHWLEFFEILCREDFVLSECENFSTRVTEVRVKPGNVCILQSGILTVGASARRVDVANYIFNNVVN